MSLSTHLRGLLSQYDHNCAVERGLVVSSVVSHSTVTDLTTRQLGFDLTRLYLTISEQIMAHVMQTCRNGVLAKSLTCNFVQQQTLTHIVDTRRLAKFEGGLQFLLEAENDAVSWLESTAIKHL